MCVCVCVLLYAGLQQIISALEVPRLNTAVSIRRLFCEQPSHILHFTEKVTLKKLNVIQKSTADSEMGGHILIPGDSKDFYLCHYA